MTRNDLSLETEKKILQHCYSKPPFIASCFLVKNVNSQICFYIYTQKYLEDENIFFYDILSKKF